MDNASARLRIGIPLIGVKEWLGGVTYVELLVKALRLLPEQERPKVYLIVSHFGALELHAHIFSSVDGFIYLGMNSSEAARHLPKDFLHCRSYAELGKHIDFYYPVNSNVISDLCSGSWIPDFQHVHLPEFFPKQEIERRDGWFRNIAENAKLVVFSSRDSENDFRKLFPMSHAAVRVLHFHGLPPPEWYAGDPTAVQKKYSLPDEFFICCNQFWVHKNHGRLFEALAKVRQTGKEVHLVCTGSVAEWRVQDYFGGLQQFIHDAGLGNCVHILGTIPRIDQIQLMRRSLAVIQPSLFEGWSTVIEDGRSLGKTMLLSDLPVHYEQCPDHASYFDRYNAEALSKSILELLPVVEPGPNFGREEQAGTNALELVLNYAREFCDIATEAQRLFGRTSAGAVESAPVARHEDKQPQSETHSAAAISVATSLAPGNIDNQKSAVQSWLKLGFEVLSLNSKEEIDFLKEHFPDVSFIEVSRTAASITGKPYTFFDDILKALFATDSGICGIVNSDIHLIDDEGFRAFILAEAKDTLVYGTRIDVDSLDSLKGTEYRWGFDYFFFDKSVISLYPSSNFSMGAPWWDLWACFVPSVRNVPIKRFKYPVGYHKNHPKNWSYDIWVLYFQEFLTHLSENTINPYLSQDFISNTNTYLSQKKFSEFSAFVVLDIEQKSKRISFGTKDDEPDEAPVGINDIAEVHAGVPMQGDEPSQSLDVSIIVATKDRAALLDNMLSTLPNAAKGLRYEVIVVEGESKDNTKDVLQKHGITNIYSERKHLGEGKHSWARLYNFGFSKASGKWAMFASDDILFGPECLSQAVAMLNPLENSIAGGIFFYKNVQPDPDGAGLWNDFGIDYTYGQRLLLNYGLVRLDAFREVNGLDEQYEFYCADGDLCLKFYDKGWELVPLPSSFVVHNNVLDAQKWTQTQGSEKDIDRYAARWRHFVSTSLPSPRRLMWKDFVRDPAAAAMPAESPKKERGPQQSAPTLAAGADALDGLRKSGIWKDGQPLRLHLGCGEQHFAEYINIDYPPSEHAVMNVAADVYADITSLDFPPGSVDEIRLHHVFEHFNRVTSLWLLMKWHTWLKIGGVLWIETPDLIGSAKTLLSDMPWRVKTGVVRHIAGDQSSPWAYHIDHWFPERFEKTLRKMGFDNIHTESVSWQQEPYLSNVHAVAVKRINLTVKEMLRSADELLWESTVSENERPTYEVWRKQLRDLLSGGPTETTLPSVSKSVTLADSAGCLSGNYSELPLNEIHDFNQKTRDSWVREKAKQVPAGSEVLDIGAGTCPYRPLFSHCNYRTHDFKKYEGQKLGGTTEYGKIDFESDITSIPVNDASFDVILCTEVLEHVPEPLEAVREMVRLLKPGGKLLLTAPLSAGLHQLPYHFYGGYTPEWYRYAARKFGLRLEEVRPNGGFFRLLSQECARVAWTFDKHKHLHGERGQQVFQLFNEVLPRFLFGIEEECFVDEFTVGYHVEMVKPLSTEDSDVDSNISEEELRLLAVLQKDFRNVPALVALAGIEMRRTNRGKARNYLIGALALEPENAEAKAMWAKIEEGPRVQGVEESSEDVETRGSD